MTFWLPLLSTILSAYLLGGCTKDVAPQTSRNVQAVSVEQGDSIDVEAPVYRVRYTGRADQTADQLRLYALRAAAESAHSQGHTHFAVIEEGSETVEGSGPISSVTARVPIVRSRRKGGRSRGSGSSMSIELGRPTAPAYFIRMRPFSGKPPQGAIETYSVGEFQ